MSRQLERAEKLRLYGRRMIALADDMSRECGKDTRAVGEFTDVPPALLYETASRLATEREKRACLGLQDLLTEPAWDILLALYLETTEEAEVMTKVAYLSTNVPPTTCLRYVDILVERGVIVRKTGSDLRCKYIALSREGRALMDRYLLAVANLPKPRSDGLDDYVYASSPESEQT